MLAGVTDCRRNQKWAAKEDGHWDLNPGAAAIEREDHVVLRGKEEGHAVLKWGKGPRSSEGE